MKDTQRAIPKSGTRLGNEREMVYLGEAQRCLQLFDVSRMSEICVMKITLGTDLVCSVSLSAQCLLFRLALQPILILNMSLFRHSISFGTLTFDRYVWFENVSSFCIFCSHNGHIKYLCEISRQFVSKSYIRSNELVFPLGRKENMLMVRLILTRLG